METNLTAVANALSWSIIHSLWQGGILFVLLLLYFSLHKNAKAAQKYLVTFSSLLVLAAATVITFLYKLNTSHAPQFNEVNATAMMKHFSIIIEMEDSQNFTDFINQNSHQITNIWLIGTALFMLKYLASYIFLVVIRRNNANLRPEQFSIDMDRLKAHFGITHEVMLKNYKEKVSPFTTGLVKPVIFFPMVLLNRLTLEEIECILAHEMAHIKRYDYLTNAVATVIETVLYYHPVVWWIQKKMAIYREEACDDMAVGYKGDALLYAQALVKLQELISQQEQNTPALAMAFVNDKKNILLNRIKRMFNMHYSPINIKEKLAASVFIFLFAFGMTELYALKSETKDLSIIENIKNLVTNPLEDMANDTIPPSKVKKKEKIAIIKEEGDKKIGIKIEDGDIKELTIDGKEIPKEEYDQYRDIIGELKPIEGRKAFILSDGEDIFSFEDLGIELEGLSGLEENSLEKLQKKLEKLHELQARDFERDQKRMERDQERHAKEMERYHKEMEKYHRKMEKLGKDFKGFSFPDSSFQFYKLNGDSIFNFNKLFEGNDSLFSRFNFRFPEGLDKHFKFAWPDRDLNIDGDNFRIIIPDDHDLFNFEDIDRLDDLPKNFGQNNLEELIGKQLNKDGFLIANKTNKVELSGKHLKINGEKQPSNIWNKYKNLFERETGMPLNKDTKLVFEVEGKEAKRKYKAF